MNASDVGTTSLSPAATSPAAPATPTAGRFSLRSFAPGWGAAVMGTSALSVALLVAGEGTLLESLTQWAAWATLVVAMLAGAAVLGVTAGRWVRHRDAALDDLRHPIRGGMTATSAGALLTLAVAVGKVGPGMLPGGAILPAVVTLTVSGAALALLVGWEFLAAMFDSRDVELAQVSGSWFVPPVVAVIVPLAMLPIVTRAPELAEDLLPLAWAFLGIGAVLYLVVTATLFVRSVSHPLPPAALAPTLFIGMGPAGLLALDMVRLAQTSADVGAADDGVVGAVVPMATAMWGFGLWWMLAALRVLGRGYRSLPFALSWWGFTFPLAAWTIATVVLARVWESGMLSAIGLAATVALAALWAYVASRTVGGLWRGTIWGH